MKGEKIYKRAQQIHKRMYELSNSVDYLDRLSLYNTYLNLIRRSAYKGNSEAQYDLGQQYENMNYLDINNPLFNPKKRFFWYSKACDQNHPAACNNLAHLYELGEGCNQDLDIALKLYKKSAELGYSLAKKNYKIMLKQLYQNS